MPSRLIRGRKKRHTIAVPEIKVITSSNDVTLTSKCELTSWRCELNNNTLCAPHKGLTSVSQTKPKLAEPLDYETVLVRNKTLLHNDPQRDLLLFPTDDVSQSTIPRRFRTTLPSIPENAVADAQSLMVKECIKSYSSQWNRIHYKYCAYSSSYMHLPEFPRATDLESQVYEVDRDQLDEDQLAKQNKPQQITKQGWLYKGPDANAETSFISFPKAQKKRYFYLKQQKDATYVLEYTKDDKKGGVCKDPIFLDAATHVLKSNKRGKMSIELKMLDDRFYTFAADTEAELDSWVEALNKVIANNEQGSVDRFREQESGLRNENFEASLEKSMNPELQKYARETDSLLAQQRTLGRQKLFAVYPEVQKQPHCPEVTAEASRDHELYKETFGARFLVECEDFMTRLQTNINDIGREIPDNPEPFFITFALYDCNACRKVSEDFHWEPNHQIFREYLAPSRQPGSPLPNGNKGDSNEGPALNGQSGAKMLIKGGRKPDWLMYPNRAIFSVTNPHADIYLVARIEKVLQGNINQSADPYTKSPDPKVAAKIHKNVRHYCSKLGQYRMPFAWAARPMFKLSKGKGGLWFDSEEDRPLFKTFTYELDQFADFAIYRADGNKISEEDIIHNLQDFKKPEKQGKWQPVYAQLKVKITNYQSPMKNIVTSALVPVKPFPEPPESPPSLEVEEFVPAEGKYAQPYSVYKNHLYVYPKNLKYDGQKVFAKARNIACHVQLKEYDSETSAPLCCIYDNQGDNMFTTTQRCGVLHHYSSPDFTEEVKIKLPTQLHERHHVVFTFYHVSCDLSRDRSSKKAHQSENIVGYAWFPVTDRNGRVNDGEQHVKLAQNLPSGYLGKGALSSDIRWVDSGKPLFKFSMRLCSSIYTEDQHMHRFFNHCSQSPTEGPTVTSHDAETVNKLKSLHAVEVHTLIDFLPTLLNQLFRLLVQTVSEEVAQNTTSLLIHIVSKIHEVHKPDILTTYVKYVFVTEPAASPKDKTVHEELANHLTRLLRPNRLDQHIIAKFMEHASFFFDILTKSMAQHLLSTGRIKMQRHERFPASYQMHTQHLINALAQHIEQKSANKKHETAQANASLAGFIKRCFTFMDRGFVFRQMNTCIETFSANDTKVLQEYRLEFLKLVCEHEHYIPLNLPLMKKSAKNYREMQLDQTLSEEFCKNHFLVGLLLQEVKQALNVIKDVRKVAIGTLRNLLAKHCFDSRYKGKSHQERIATLYLPFISIILENKHRLTPKETLPCATANDTLTSASGSRANTLDSNQRSLTLPSDASLNHSGDFSAFSGSSRDSMASSGDSSLTPRSGGGQRRYQKDPSVFAMISGQVSTLNKLSDVRASQLNGSSGSLNSNNSESGSLRASVSNMSEVSSGTLESSSSGNSAGTVTGMSTDGQLSRTASARSSLTSVATKSNTFVTRYDKLDQQEIKDLLVSFLFIVHHLPTNVLLAWFSNSSELDVIEFFEVLEICLDQFKYMGKKRITSLYVIGSSQKRVSIQLPAGAKKLSLAPTPRTNSMFLEGHALPVETDGNLRADMEANLSTEVSMIVLDIVSCYTQHYKDTLLFRDGDNSTMQSLFHLQLQFLRNTQSQLVQKNAFASIRAYIRSFSKVLFEGEASMCGRMCYELLKCCNSKLYHTRSEACAVMYILMRANFDHSKGRGFNRVHLQMIVAVSQLISNQDGLRSSLFIDSLTVINNYANNDNTLKKTVFPAEVKDLTRRIRTVLMATARMREHENDPEMLVDLQYSLAKSYTSTPELRKTWLESMANTHERQENFSEAAHCKLHIAALVAEYLKRRGEFPQGCAAFAKISGNVQGEEAGMRDDLGMEDVQYSLDNLTELLEECARLFEKAERYESLGDIYRLIIPIYEQRRDFTKLAAAYKVLHSAYSNIVEVMATGKRLLGNYFKVSFYGQLFEEESTREYVYKEPKVTGLPEVCDRLKNMYTEKLGKGKVKLIMESGKVRQEDLDPNIAYIQITYVKPYFEQKELEERLTDFEKNNNIRRFMYETPFTRNGKAHGEVHEQWKRRTVLTTTHAFPYVKKRIGIEYHHSVDLSPIEFAIDAMRNKVGELNEVVYQTNPDLKRLQLKLQGAVSTTVHAGPCAYAEAFLRADSKHPPDKVEDLKQLFREFVNICHAALDLNGRLISSDQYTYHQSLKDNFRILVTKLSNIFNEPLLADELGISAADRRSISSYSIDSNISNYSHV